MPYRRVVMGTEEEKKKKKYCTDWSPELVTAACQAYSERYSKSALSVYSKITFGSPSDLHSCTCSSCFPSAWCLKSPTRWNKEARWIFKRRCLPWILVQLVLIPRVPNTTILSKAVNILRCARCWLVMTLVSQLNPLGKCNLSVCTVVKGQNPKWDLFLLLTESIFMPKCLKLVSEKQAKQSTKRKWLTNQSDLLHKDSSNHLMPNWFL